MRHIGNKIFHGIFFKAGRTLFLLAFLLSVFRVSGQDTVIHREIHEITIGAEKKHNVTIKDNNRIVFSPEGLSNTLRVFGEADPMKYILTLPGVSTSSDYASGISVQGCDYSQTFVGMAGAPVFFPYHLFGIFSVCNPTHFADVSLEKSIHGADFENRLGGLIDLRPKQKILKHLTGDFNVGMLASGFTLGVPCGKKFSVYASSRISYISLFYKKLLQTGRGETMYNFQDANLTAVYKFNYYNKLVFNAFVNNDDFSVNETSALNLNLYWENSVSSFLFEHEGNFNFNTSVFYSGFSSGLRLLMSKNIVSVPSEISAYGINFNSSFFVLTDKIKILSGFTVTNYAVQPQGVDSDFGGNLNPEIFDTETKLYAEGVFVFSPKINLHAGVKHSGIFNSDYCDGNFSPLLTLNFEALTCKFSAHYSIYYQYLHQIGFSDVGLSTNSWIAASGKLPPQKANSFSLSCLKDFSDYQLQFETYYKKVSSQSEFFGNIFDLFSKNYCAENYTDTGNGYNSGFDLIFKKNGGKITGYAGYALGYARRKFGKFSDGYLPSSNEVLHNAKVNLSVKIGRQWVLSSLFNYSYGRPVTPIKYVYMIGEKMIAEYGKHNSARMKDYHRLDFAATYRFCGKRHSLVTHNINLSVLNVYGRKNTELSYYKFYKEKNQIRYREKTSLFRFLPSLSYSVNF